VTLCRAKVRHHRADGHKAREAEVVVESIQGEHEMKNIFERRALHDAAIRRTDGFTLLELLIVVSIIALLAAILFPAFSRARENARRSSCQSNLKQIGLAMAQYTQDYDERMIGVRTGGFGTPGFSWTALVQPYLKSRQVLLCSSKNGVDTSATPIISSYTYNWWVAQDTAGPRQISSIPLPSQTPAVLDGLSSKDINQALVFILPSAQTTNDNVMNGRLITAGSAVNSSTDSEFGVVRPRHFDGPNVLFVDGHVKWFAGVSGCTGNAPDAASCPPRKGLDYDVDGLLGDEGTLVGKWD
jgi:prepilin-type N-terminal cleavage/methylation domain-containing protein/prepilin-type processing-associated H-X9-DG protein